MTDPYPYGPLLPEDPDDAVRAFAEALKAAYDDLEAERLRVELMVRNGATRAAVRRLADLQRALVVFQAAADSVVRRFLEQHLTRRYATGITDAFPGEVFTWTTPHVEALTALATDSYADFLARAQEAGRVTEAFARQVREAARSQLPKAAAGGRTAVDVGRRLERDLRAGGVNLVTYADGSRYPVRAYAEMAARTKTAVAHNTGALVRCSELGVSWVEIVDGSGCGWTSHDDADKAAGSIRHVREAASHPISHPQCRRSLLPRPDVRRRDEARDTARLAPLPPPVAAPAPQGGRAAAAEARRALTAQRRARRAAG